MLHRCRPLWILAAITSFGAAAGPQLPVPCFAGGCGANVSTFVGQGSATAVASGNSLTVRQTSESALLNWQSFNIAAGGTVTFKQPDASALALNQIFQADPSRIAGVLRSNGRIYLLNQNGIIFGAGAQISVGGLLASSLNLSPSSLQSGIAAAAASGSPALQPYVDANGNELVSGPITVEAGAQITSAQGQVLLFAPTVTNSGKISTPDGQTILAAGQRVFLLASTDPNLRGLLVEVGDGGTVTNGSAPGAPVAEIVADRGNVTLAGAIVRQSGTITASTSVRANGSIRLQARDTPSDSLASPGVLDAPRGGELDLAPGSVTAVGLDTTDTGTTVDVNTQPQSIVDLSAKTINILSGATVQATAGQITALAASNPGPSATDQQLSSISDGSELLIASGARLDVSGAVANLPMSRNSLAVELRGNQLADSPLQRTGPLRSETVYVDVRDYGTRADGTTWVGTPLADLSGDIADIQRGVAERNLTGGTIQLKSQGEVIVGQGAVLDVSGGHINWQSGIVKTSQLLGTDGKLYDIAQADPNRQYTGIVDSVTVSNPHFGVTQQYNSQNANQFEAGYQEGRSAGTVDIIAPVAVLDGDIVGKTVVGPLQVRDPRTAYSSSGLIGSISDVVPSGATLNLGLPSPVATAAPDYVVTNVEFANGSVLGSGLAAVTATPTAVPDPTTVRLRPDLFGASGVQNLNIFANGTVSLGRNMAFTLPEGGTFAVSAGRIVIDSDLVVPSGTISLAAQETLDYPGLSPATATGVTLGAGASILAQGQWVNESASNGPTNSVPLYTSGGSVSVTASDGSVNLVAGGVIDVSGGAELTYKNAVVAGKAGSIAISSISTSGEPTEVSLGKQLRGFGISDGGSVSVQANSVCIAKQACSSSPYQLQLNPEWFQSGGFADISVSSSLGSLELLGGTALQLQQENFVLTAAAATAPTGTRLSSIATVEQLPLGDRQAVNLTLNGSYLSNPFQPTGNLLLDADSSINADPLATVSLVSNSSIMLNGTVDAPGGNISVVLNNKAKTDYVANQAIWLGPTAVLEARGAVVYQQSTVEPLAGSVLDGGTVELDAERGYVFTDPKSLIDVSGISAPVDILDPSGRYNEAQIGSNGGNVGFFAVEGMQLDGQMAAKSGGTSGTMGGALSVTLDPTARVGSASGGYPVDDHEILIGATVSPIVVGEGTNAPGLVQGFARLAAPLITEAGFDSATLSARNQFVFDPNTGSSALAGYGKVIFDSGVDLAVGARLAVDAPVIGMDGGGRTELQAAYVSLGTSDTLSQDVPAAAAGSGALVVGAKLVDFFGNISLSGVSSISVRSSGDIRASGVFSTTDQNFDGQLSLLGQIDLTAQQIYPTTLSDFVFNALGPDGTISTHSVAGTPGVVLSAGGTLTLNGAEIDQGGTLRAPLGELILNAPTINALAGSVLSTSLDGETVPFGQTEGGLDWVYPVQTGARVYSSTGIPLPSQNIIMNGATINLAHGSVIDVSGGGDLLAYEFIPGPGGTKDVLSPSVLPNQFAVLPSLNSGFAPIDPLYSTGTSLQPGDEVYLSGGGGLAAGFYTLLPARYALLPGAFLVHSVSGYQDLAPGESISASDGGTIVSGRRAVAGTAFIDPRSSGFEIQPGSVAQLDAQYDISLANSFFAPASSSAGAAPAPSTELLPRDAGAVSLIASSSFVLDAQLRSSAGPGGVGASLELSSDKLLVTDDSAQAPPGFVAVSPEQIASFGAQTVLLGGERQSTATGVEINVSASTVEIGAGVQLSGPDVIVVAQDLLKMDAGSKVSASGSLSGAPETSFALDANSSFLQVSVGPQVDITRGTNGSGAGLMEFASGSVIASSGSVALDAGVSAQTANTFDVTGSLSLAAPNIAIGKAPSSFSGIVFDPGRSIADSLTELVLIGRTSIDLFAGADISASTLTLATPVLLAGGDGVNARLSANELHLTGTPALTTAAATGSDGSLLLSAQQIDASGSLSLLGFKNTNVSATKLFNASGSGALSSSGNLNLATAWITTGMGVEYAITTQGDVQLQALAAPSTAELGSLGGSLSITANAVRGDLRAALPSGQISLEATGGDLDIGSHSVLDVAGHPTLFNGESVSAPGGEITMVADTGSVTVASGTVLDVSSAAGTSDAATGITAGTVNFYVPDGALSFNGTVRGGASQIAEGGNLNVTADSLNLDALLSAFSAGQFTGAWSLRQTGAGNFTVRPGSALRVSSLALTADDGGIDIGGNIVADSPRGGYVGLDASGAITVSGSISARATDTGVSGGRVELFSASSIALDTGSLIDVGGSAPSDPALTAGGSVYLRLPQSAVQTVLNGPNNSALRLSGSIEGAKQVTIEGYTTYQLPDGQIGPSQVLADPSNPWFSNAAAFAGQAPQILAALDQPSKVYQVIPGIEVDSPGDIHLAADWNLYDWHFGNVAGTLTLRAAGNLYVDNSLSDGFASINQDSSSYSLPTQSSQSWSYRLTAGAALASANPLATLPGSALPNSGDLEIAPGVPLSAFAPGTSVSIRTGTGRIDIATANDLVFGNQASVIYTAGVAGPGIQIADDQSVGGLSDLAYPFNGGDIRITAGRDIIGPQSTQLWTEWLWRTGGLQNITPYPTAWSVAFGQFEQGVAALGGGNVTLIAGRDIIDMSASTPSVGRQVGGMDSASSVVQVTDGGDLTVHAGRDLLGGTYYSDLGVSQISAGDVIGPSVGQQGLSDLAPVLAIGAGTLQVQSERGLSIATIVNPTLIDVSTMVPPGVRTYLSTYTDDTAVSLLSVSGELNLMGNQTTLLERFPDYPQGIDNTTPLKVLPPTVNAVDLGGSIQIGGSMTLWPAPRGNLQLLAGGSIALESVVPSEDLQILISDAAVNDLPTAAAPGSDLSNVNSLLTAVTRVDPRFDAPQPVHDPLGAGPDPAPVELVANDGDITMQAASAGKVGLLFSPKPIEVSASRDIVNFSADIENLTSGDVSSLSAGRDFIYEIARDAAGNVLTAAGGITVEGPGQLEVIAGRNFDLSASSGLVSVGNIDNRALPALGANISVWAGLNGLQPGYAPFIKTYLVDSDTYDQFLEDFVAQESGASPATKSTALEAFESYDLATQRSLLEQILFAELRAGGRSAAAPGPTHDDFSRAFTALDTLFPGANPDLSKGQTDPYSGDILLYFSRIYTLSGGDIDLIAPGGEINVGLATAPTAFGLNKKPAQLGLVAQSTGSINALSYSDFQVNQSRVFAADGGNILVWSTEGNIDAGRGAKTAISAPPPVITVDAEGQVQVVFPAALAGSGIQTLATTPGTNPGDVDLFAPRGVVNANDAGIVAGNLTIAATAVLGTNNITVSGTSVGVPVDTGGLGASLVGASSSAAAASNAAQASVVNSQDQKKDASPLADSALTWIDVFVTGLGEEGCRPDDVECLKRQKK